MSLMYHGRPALLEPDSVASLFSTPKSSHPVVTISVQESPYSSNTSLFATVTEDDDTSKHCVSKLNDQHSAKANTSRDLQHQKVPPATAAKKLREGLRLSSDKLRLLLLEREKPYKPLSAKGRFQHYYVDPHCFWWGKNDRTLLSQTLPSVNVRDRDGNIQMLVNGGTHNYAGFYKLTAESEELQRTCLEKLPFADVKGIPSLEKAMNDAVCQFCSVDFCVTASSGFGMNTLALPAVVNETWLVLVDEKSHNSMFIGAFLAGPGLIKKFRHNDMAQLAVLLQKLGPQYPNVIVLIEGLYSMDGTSPDLAGLSTLKNQYHFTLYCDEAHSFLSIGSSGRGCLELWNDENPDNTMPNDLIDLRTATLSKSVGGLGGIVFGAEKYEKALRDRCEYLYQRGHESVSTSTVIQTLLVLGQSKCLRRRLHHLHDLTIFCKEELRRHNVHVYGNSLTPILPVFAGRPTVAAKLSYELRKLGLLATPVTAPAVEFWESRVRVTLSAEFSDSEVNKLLDAIIEGSRITGVSRKTKAPRRKYNYTGSEPVDEEHEEYAECISHINALIKCDIDYQRIYRSTTISTFKKNCGSVVIQAGNVSRVKYGLGSGGSRWVTGTFEPHLEVEQSLVKITKQEAVMTFANAEIGLTSTIAALCRPLLGYKKHFFLLPSQCHQTVREGLLVASKRDMPEIMTFENTEELLAITGSFVGEKSCITICVDTVVDGSLVKLDELIPQLLKCKNLSGMTLLLNDTNGLGHSGPNRLGIAGSIDATAAAKALGVNILVYGSFNRAFGLSGGYLAGSDVLIQELRFTSRGYMFSTSPQPFVMDMIRKALEMRMTLAEAQN